MPINLTWSILIASSLLGSIDIMAISRVFVDQICLYVLFIWTRLLSMLLENL